MTLAEAGLETLKLFKQVAARQPTSLEWPQTQIAAEADRFELWAVNLGLFVSGHGSLDYRVRGVESLGRTLQRFITDLNDSLAEVLEYAAGESNQRREEDDGHPARGLPSSKREPETEDSGDESAQDSESDVDLLLDSIRDPIDRLYKLSTRIRNPSSRLGSSKALRHQQIDEETGMDLLQCFERFDYDYVIALFLQYRKSKALEEYETVEPPKCEDNDDDADIVWEPIRAVLSQHRNDLSKGTESFLVSRIARANIRRRQQFSYWKKHRDKLSQHTQAFTQHVETRKQMTPTHMNMERQVDGYLDAMAMIVSAQSVTTASRLNIPQLNIVDGRSTASVSEYAPSTWRPGKEAVDFPPPPKRRPGDKFFECPYCFILCSTELLGMKAWKAHLIHDLHPYLCTYEECRNPDQLYDTRQDWIKHENSAHRRVWRCPEHPSRTWTQFGSYQEHFRKEHAEYNRQMSSNQTIQTSESTLTSPDRPCPICSANLDTAKALQSHVALHLERFSIFSLPRSVDKEDDESEGGDSDQVNLVFEGSRDEDFDSDTDVQGETDLSTSAAAIARQRWKTVLDSVLTTVRASRRQLFLQRLADLRTSHSAERRAGGKKSGKSAKKAAKRVQQAKWLDEEPQIPDLPQAAAADDDWAEFTTTKTKDKKKKGKKDTEAAAPTTTDANATSIFHDISLDDDAPRLDFSFGENDSKTKATDGGGFGTWGNTWDFSNIGTATTTDKKEDKTAKAGKDKDAKEGTSEFGENNPWSLGEKSKTNKKTISSGFDFGDFGAIDETNNLTFEGDMGMTDINAADTSGWGFTSVNKKDKKKKGKDAADEKAVEETKVPSLELEKVEDDIWHITPVSPITPLEVEKVEDDIWSAGRNKKDKKKGKKGTEEESAPMAPPPPPPPPPPPVAPEPPAADEWSFSSGKKDKKKGKKALVEEVVPEKEDADVEEHPQRSQ